MLLLIKFYQNFMNNTDNTAKALNDAQKWLRQLSCAEANTFFEKNLLPYIEALYREEPTSKKKVLGKYREMLNSDYPFNSPYHWAAFVATGI